MYPENLHYTKEHEWVAVTAEKAIVGLTDFAQKELGDVVFVELPEVGRNLGAGDEFGTVESVKAVSEIYAPVACEILEVNKNLEDHPEIINEDPYGRGWLLKIKIQNPAELESLMDAAAYQASVGESAK